MAWQTLENEYLALRKELTGRLSDLLFQGVELRRGEKFARGDFYEKTCSIISGGAARPSAQRACQYYLDHLAAEPGYRAQPTAEVRARWERYCVRRNGVHRPRRPACVEGTYYIRGENRKLAQENSLTVGYNRLAMMAINVFHLAHWQLDVTVANYLLAI